MLTVKINGIDRTERVSFNGSLKIQDNINQQRDTLSFEVRKAPSKDWYPQKADEIIVEYGASDPVRIFGGIITGVERSIESINLAVFRCEAVDWSFLLDRKLVVERYTSEYISDIISDLITKYAPTFTMENVVGDEVITAIVFNGIKISECIEKLSQLTSYSWYVDADKDIHFFPKNQDPSPFNISDTSENYIWESLKISDDFSQIRNSVVVKGGDIEGNTLSEVFTASGTEDERKLYSTAHKFAHLPEVKVNGGAALSGGVDYINDDADYDFMWDYSQKYVRFTSGHIPDEGDVVTISGIPLYRLIGRLNDSKSIKEYGIYEHQIEDENIRSKEEILLRASSEFYAYKNGVIEGEFQTYDFGLRSGQVININSELRGVDEDFLIQSVSFSAITPDGDGIWNVKLATLRTVGIIEFLQSLLRSDGIDDGSSDLLLSFYQYDDVAEASDSVTFPANTSSPPYTWEDETGVSESNPVRWNFFTWT